MPPRRHLLVVANRTAATPALLVAVRRHARQAPTRFSLLVPDLGHADWTLEQAVALLERAAGGPVAGLTGVPGERCDGIIVSTRSARVERRLRRALPGVPAEVVAPERRRLRDGLADTLSAERSGLPLGGFACVCLG